MQQPKSHKQLTPILLIVVPYLQLVIYLFIMIYPLYQYIFIIQQFDRVSCLISNDIVGDKFKRFYLL